MNPAIQIWTNFGDLAVLLPLAAVVALWLGAIRQPILLVWWLGAVAFCAGTTAVLKIYFFVCPPLTDLHSPSGHTSFSTLVYGTITLALATELSGWRRAAIASGGAVFVIGIGVSRVLVNAHSIPEVLLGWLIGSATLSAFAHRFLRHPRSGHRLNLLIAGSVLLMILLNGQDLSAEDMLHAIGISLRHAGMACT